MKKSGNEQSTACKHLLLNFLSCVCSVCVTNFENVNKFYVAVAIEHKIRRDTFVFVQLKGRRGDTYEMRSHIYIKNSKI